MEDEIIANGMDLKKWLPDYYQVTPPRFLKTNWVEFRLRSLNRNLFINALYEALFAYMNALGYDVSRDEDGYEIIEIFPYYYKNNYMHLAKVGEFKKSYYKRIELRSKSITTKGVTSYAKWVCARFFDNNPSRDFGVSFQIYARTVFLRLDVSVYNLEKENGFNPCKYFREFLLKISYLQQMYNYLIKNGYITRLFNEYPKLLLKVERYADLDLLDENTYVYENDEDDTPFDVEKE